jgi:hypothetical protein
LLNLAYGYNGNATDIGDPWAYGEHPPAQGAMFLNQKMSAFMYFNNSTSGPMGDPRISAEYYYYLQGKWRDGTPLTSGGTGYDPESTDYTNFAYSGNPVTGSGWTEVGEENIPGDRRGILSAGPFTLPAGGSICIDIALPFAQDLEGNNITSVAMLKEKAEAIQQFYNKQNYEMACSGNIGVKENEKNNGKVQIYPNPTTGELTITNYELEITNVEIFDVYGKLLSSHPLIPSSSHHKIDLSHLINGIYLVKMYSDNNQIVTKRLVIIK